MSARQTLIDRAVRRVAQVALMAAALLLAAALFETLAERADLPPIPQRSTMP